MMKSLISLIVFACIAFTLISAVDMGEQKIYVVKGNQAKEPLEIVFNRYFCSQDRVAITEYFNTAQAIRPNGDTYFFNDIGSLFLWLERQEEKDELTLFVYAQDTERYVPARSAWYSRIEVTPMGYGFGAYEFQIYALADHYFDEMYTCAIRGETLWNPIVRRLLVENKL